LLDKSTFCSHVTNLTIRTYAPTDKTGTNQNLRNIIWHPKESVCNSHQAKFQEKNTLCRDCIAELEKKKADNIFRVKSWAKETHPRILKSLGRKVDRIRVHLV
jgi:hypothetical protein